MLENVVLHICCGPCAIIPFKELSKDYHITGFFYNPNIHPINEYKERLRGVKKFAREYEMKLEISQKYPLKEFLKGLICSENRCHFCLANRLEITAEYASKNGFDAFTTTLLVSPYQKHDYIRKKGYDLGKEYGLQFLYIDFRKRFGEGAKISKELGLYRQKYCGCIFSEFERFKPAFLKS